MKVSGKFGQDLPTERAKGPVSISSLNGQPVLSVPAPNGVIYLIEVEDRDIGTLQAFLGVLMREEKQDANSDGS